MSFEAVAEVGSGMAEVSKPTTARFSSAAQVGGGWLAGSRNHRCHGVRQLLRAPGFADQVRREGIAVLRDGNEDSAGFRVTSPYRVLELRPAQ